MDSRQQAPQTSLGSLDQVAPAGDQPHGVRDLAADLAREGFIELTGAESLDAIGRAYADVARRRLAGSQHRLTDESSESVSVPKGYGHGV